MFFSCNLERLFESRLTTSLPPDRGRGSVLRALSGFRRLTAAAIDKIAQQENDGILPGATREKTDRLAEIRALSLGFDRQKLPNDI